MKSYFLDRDLCTRMHEPFNIVHDDKTKLVRLGIAVYIGDSQQTHVLAFTPKLNVQSFSACFKCQSQQYEMTKPSTSTHCHWKSAEDRQERGKRISNISDFKSIGYKPVHRNETPLSKYACDPCQSFVPDIAHLTLNIAKQEWEYLYRYQVTGRDGKVLWNQLCKCTQQNYKENYLRVSALGDDKKLKGSWISLESAVYLIVK